jgi:hypothetical protein
MQEKELNNGRLAMIAAIGFIAQEANTGTTWSESAMWVSWFPSSFAAFFAPMESTPYIYKG